jgi:hypothetical protein
MRERLRRFSLFDRDGTTAYIWSDVRQEIADLIECDLLATNKPRTGDTQPSEARAPASPAGTILSFGDKKYGNGVVVQVVTDSEDAVLTAFLDHQAMDLPDLTKRAGEGALKVLSRLRSKYGGIFASAISRPGARSRGGYRVSIRKA